MQHRLSTSLVLLLVLLGAAVIALPGTARANGCPLRFTQGTAGTADDPIRIETVADLQVLSGNASCYASAYHFRQTADLALTGLWVPIGPSVNPFNGTYDGGGHAITGLRVTDASAGTYKGLFGVVSAGTVRNLIIRNASIIGTLYYYGVLAGHATNGALIENVSIADSTIASGGYGSEYMGGVTGALTNATVRNAHVSGMSVAIAVTNDYIGGITGEAHSGSVIEQSSADVSISGAGSYVGGIAGVIESSATITDSFARGSVVGTYRVGGLLGAYYAGGGPITRSYATTRVAAAGAGTAGGLVGSVITTPVAADAVASFWDTQTSDQATSANGAVGRSTAQLTALATFADAGWSIGPGWSAAKTWGICARANDGYPILTGAYTAATEPCTDRTPAAASATPASTAPSATVLVRNARLSGNEIRTQVTVSGPGTLRQVGGVQQFAKTIEDDRAARATMMSACSTKRSPTKAGVVSLTCRLNARTLRLVRRQAIVIRLKTTFTPTTGAAASSMTVVAMPKRSERPQGSGAAPVRG